MQSAERKRNMFSTKCQQRQISVWPSPSARRAKKAGLNFRSLKGAPVNIPGTRGGNGGQGVPPPRRRHPVQRRLLHVVAVLHRWAESGWVRSTTATWGFAQSAILPGPDCALLIPLGLADPKRVFSFALWTTVGSFFGALAAYSIGVFAFDRLGIPLLSLVGIGTDNIQQARNMFAEHTLLVVLAGSMGLVPSKLMSITAGGFGVPFVPFALVFLVGRSARYVIVATIIRYAGSRLVAWIERRVGRPLATLR
ncbi:MAG: hypothetical protein AAB150_18125 [Pseudomonadota bacterium]